MITKTGQDPVLWRHPFMARIAAEHLVDHLARSGFVVRKHPPSGDLAHLDVRPTRLTD